MQHLVLRLLVLPVVLLMMHNSVRSPFSFYSRKKHSITVQETEISSSWNHIFKVQRQGPPRRRTKIATGRSLQSSHLPRISGRWKRWELEQANECPREQTAVRRASNVSVVGTFGCVLRPAKGDNGTLHLFLCSSMPMIQYLSINTEFPPFNFPLNLHHGTFFEHTPVISYIFVTLESITTGGHFLGCGI